METNALLSQLVTSLESYCTSVASFSELQKDEIVTLVTNCVQRSAVDGYPSLCCWSSLQRLSHCTLRLFQQVVRRNDINNTIELVLLKKVLAFWRNTCPCARVRELLTSQGLTKELVQHLPTLCQENEYLPVITIMLQLVANVTNDHIVACTVVWKELITDQVLCRLMIALKSPSPLTDYNSKILTALLVLISNLICYLSDVQQLSKIVTDNFWNPLLSWITDCYQRHMDTNDIDDLLHWLFIIMRQIAEKQYFSCWLLYLSSLFPVEQIENDSSQSCFSVTPLMLRTTLFVGREPIELYLEDCKPIIEWFSYLAFYCWNKTQYAGWIELCAILLADNVISDHSYKDEDMLMVSLVDACCHLLQCLQEDSFATRISTQSIGWKTNVTRLLANICSSSKNSLKYLISKHQYVVTLCKQWQLDVQSPFSFEWTVFLFRFLAQEPTSHPHLGKILQQLANNESS